MGGKNPLYVSFLWHMHQPWYLWDTTGEAAMPWVRLHALKDYYDMALLCDQMGFPCTINIVPSLMRQIELLASEKTTDPFWETFLLDMQDMNEEQLGLIVDRFFDVNVHNFIEKSPRYKDLYVKRCTANDWRVFSAQEIRDIQIHFILAWFGQSLREIPEIVELIRKDKEYSDEDKATIISYAKKRISEIIPFYKELAKKGLIKFSVSPYYHPILPLLCDISVVRRANPLATLPHKQFIYPGDAVRHIKMAVEYFSALFKKTPVSLWPPEGSVSEEIISIIIESGIKFMFSDEDVLLKSLQLSFGSPVEMKPAILYQPYRIYRGKGAVDIFFRDKRLSDKIGFVYYSMTENDAVSDYIASLERIKNALPKGKKDYIVSNIMDGENAWEYYKENGKPFLMRLYGELLSHSGIIPITFEEYYNLHKEPEILDRLAPGSWIYGDFSTWCGSAEKNKAWDLLADVRNHFQMTAEKYHPHIIDQIVEHIMIAEGSDWFWWFGDNNYTPYIDIFDELFRTHLRKAYLLMGEIPSEALNEPIHSVNRPYEPVRKPLQFMKPSMEGKATSYFEWSAAGFYKATGFRSTMHSSLESLLQRVYFGFDKDNLYLRLDFRSNVIEFLAQNGRVILEFLAPKHMEIEIYHGDHDFRWQIAEISSDMRRIQNIPEVKVVCADICEMKVPFRLLSANSQKPIHLVVHLKQDFLVVQKFPPGGQFMEIYPPDEEFEDRMWYV